MLSVDQLETGKAKGLRQKLQIFRLSKPWVERERLGGPYLSQRDRF
jgi:hypothetical protein